jgi:hypothetical protein
MAEQTIIRNLDYVSETRFGTSASSEDIVRPQPAVIAKQDPKHTKADFMRDLERATRRQSD